MILLYVVAALALAVPLCGGHLGAIADIRLRMALLLVAALGVQVLVLTVPVEGSDLAHRLAHLGSYGLAGGFVLANRRVPGVPMLALSGGGNLAAIGTNGGVMPASERAFQLAGIDQLPAGLANSAPTEGAPLWFLGDVFALPASWPVATVFSVGDVGLALGAAVLLWRVCGCGRWGRK